MLIRINANIAAIDSRSKFSFTDERTGINFITFGADMS